MRKLKTLLILLLTLGLAALLSTAALADDAMGGTYGENLSWTLEEGVLTISGVGEMVNGDNYTVVSSSDIVATSSDDIPWYSQRESIAAVVIENGVTTIGSGAFQNCSSLTSVTVPSSIIYIGNAAFYGCSSLTSLTIPDSVTFMGSGVFAGCSSLTNVAIPNSVTSIGEYVFYGCSSLTSVSIPDSVTSIDSSAFMECSSLTSVTIPDSVTSIG
ncbi:MAG: leucine-rich repeat domain-containing protein, partial [Oscillospiraceae bacterium]|nr:leucine-rich repeat domain-containing protein [Oscillospiraceae bacterium]